MDEAEFLSRNLDAFRELLAAEMKSAANREGKVLVQKPIDEILREIDFENVISQGHVDLAGLVRIILANSTRLRHPRFMAHQVAVPMPSSTLADLVSGFANNGMAVYEMGPAGTAIEKGVVRWMLSKVGWKEGDGVLVHGGSLGNLSGILAARAKILPESWAEGMPPGFVILASEIAHYSVERAAAILGLGANAVIKVPVDGRLRIHVESLKRVFKEQTDAGKEILAVVANAGATANGAYDPLREIGGFCWNEGLWLHIDGCHGAAAVVSPRYRSLADGIELADSLAWDTHKLLGTSALCCGALFRDAASLAGSYAQHAPYLYGEERPGEDLSKKTFECTKALLALKLFFNLATVGESGMAEHVERLYDNTRRFHDLLAGRKGFECFGSPESNILLFRYGRDSGLQDRIRETLVREGDFFITRVTVRRETWLRLVIMNPLTADDDIRALADRIENLARA
jgi:L-2,4-diaminobutyrate decarboxylase